MSIAPAPQVEMVSDEMVEAATAAYWNAWGRTTVKGSMKAALQAALNARPVVSLDVLDCVREMRLAASEHYLCTPDDLAKYDKAIDALNARAGGGGWIAVTDRTPPEDVPVWCSINGSEPWHGAYCYAEGDEEDGAGWAWMRCDSRPYFLNGKWKCDDIEWDDQYDVTHWQPLPTPPAALASQAVGVK